MNTRVSFFLVAGFLVPGIVFGFLGLPPLVSLLLSRAQIDNWKDFIVRLSSLDGAWMVLTSIGLGLLSLLFAFGVTLSECYSKLISKCGLLPGDCDLASFEAWRKLDLGTLLEADWMCRQAYALALTRQGADLYDFAGRIKLMGASGLAVALAGMLYLFAQWWLAAFVSVPIGIAMIILAGRRTRDFRKWIAAHAALFLVSGCKISDGFLGKQEI